MRSQSVRDRHRHQHPPVPAVGSFNEYQGAIATGTGSARTCVIPIHYSWYLNNGGATGEDTVSYSYNVTALEAIPVPITTGGTTTDVVEIRRNNYTPQYNTPGPKSPGTRFEQQLHVRC